MSQDWRVRLAHAFPDQAHLVEGDAERFGLTLRSIRLVGGAEMHVQQAGVTAIVGANNAGKSTLLREVFEQISRRPGQPADPGLSVDAVRIDRSGGQEDLIAWLAENSDFVVEMHQAGFQRADTSLEHPGMLAHHWQNADASLGGLAPFVSFYGNAQGRFNVGGAAEMRESVDGPPQHAVHYLQDHRALLDRVSEVSNDVFGSRLTLDTLGRVLRLRVGEVHSEVPRLDDIPVSFREEMASLRPLDEQGDGMRSLMGQLLPVVTGAYRIIILDEPEAFLHPPQAHALGAELGRLAIEHGLQILLATHDRSLLTGLLDSQVDVSVVRLTRGLGSPTARALDASQLRTLWSDPVLRYSNILDGLFHRLVVVAEAEGDCAFMQAALDCPSRTPGTVPRNEMLFVATGGKDGMPKVCAALRAVGVPVVVAPDLDVISDLQKLRHLVESLGATFSEEMQKSWHSATEAIRASKEPAKVGHVLDAIEQALSARREESYSDDIKEAVKAQLRTSGSPWAAVKEHGIGAFKGQQYTSILTLLELLEGVGVVLVREGELERLAPEVETRKGPGWLPSALSQSAQCNPATQAHADRIVAAGSLQAGG